LIQRGGLVISTLSPPSAENAQAHGVTVAMVQMMPKPDQLAQTNTLSRREA
jgi:hypothetical protein